MASYSYRATSSEGRVVEGVMDADGEAAVVASLRSQGFIPLRIDAGASGTMRPGRRISLRMPEIALPWSRNRVRSRDLMHFTRELATLLRAGLPLDRALQSLANLAENERLREVVRKILLEVQEGKSLSEALSTHARVFPPLYVNMVRAGEAGGVVESILERLADYLERSQKAKDEITSAMTYPIILALVGSASIIILLTVVLPKFSAIFVDLGAAMPTSTRVVMAISGAIQHYWWLIALVIAAAVMGFRQWVATTRGRYTFDRFKLTIPMLGNVITKFQVSQFARTLGTMLRSGVPLIKSLEIVRNIVGNVVIRQALESVQRDVSEGKGLATPLERTGVFPSLALQMVAVGEDTGRLDEMLLVVSDHYERDFSNLVNRLMALVEPGMLIIMGLVAGFIIISMMTAIFSVNQLIQ